MLIIGCDYHPSVQQIAWVDTETGETRERRLKHSDGEAERFYRELKEKGFRVRVGMEATGHARWFERLLAELDFELWVGDPGRIRAKQVKKQKNDRRDAEHILQLLMKDDFPRLWMPTPENRDVRQLVLHRHRLVGMRTRVMNQLQAIAMNEGVRRKRGLWSKQGRAQLESLSLPPWTSHRRQELLELLDRFDPSIDQLSQAIEQEAEEWPEVKRLLTHPGVGPITALAFVLVIGTPHRFRCGKQVASYLGLVPRKTPVPIASVSATSASRAMRCCDTCWGRRRKVWLAVTNSGVASMSTWRSAVIVQLPKWPWHESLRCGCSGCGARDGIISS